MNLRRFRDMWATRSSREKIYSTSQYWDSKAEEHEGAAVSMWPNNNLNVLYHRELVSAIERLLPIVNGLRLLDVGCGTGRMSRYFAERGALALGIDFSNKAIAIARRKSPGENPTFRSLSIFDLEERDAFDAAFSWGSITMACTNQTELLDGLTRISKSLTIGGSFLICEPIHRGFLHRVLNMNIRDFCAVLRQAEFDIERVEHLHFWPLRLALAYVNWPKFMTAAGFYLGQGIMALSGRKALGDYKIICASRRNQRRTSNNPSAI